MGIGDAPLPQRPSYKAKTTTHSLKNLCDSPNLQRPSERRPRSPKQRFRQELRTRAAVSFAVAQENVVSKNYSLDAWT